MKLTFNGGVKAVTGANYLLESGETKILIDCGLRQGGKFSERQNWNDFPYNPKDIKAVFITHSHIDHIGLLPKLYRDGFRGTVYSTTPCKEFSRVLLKDSQHILEMEAERSNRPILYKEEDIAGLMKLWKGGGYHKPISLDNFTVTFYNAGHILGSSVIHIEADGRRITFSGDLGNSPAPLIGYKEELPETDYCLIESTYGDRIHEDIAERKGTIENMIENVVKSKGTLMIPAFAMERSQQLLFVIHELIDEGRVPKVPVFLDSPLAIRLTEIYRKHRNYFSKDVITEISPDEPIFNFPGLKKTLTTMESKSINEVDPPKVIIAGSGMMHAGRILHHLKHHLPDPNSILLIVGFQAKGSLGRQLFDGRKKVRIHGADVEVNCQIKAIGGYSAHADQPQLLDWLRPRRKTLKKVFVVQGEEDASAVLRDKIRDELVITASIPQKGITYDII
jgi:metallo-beta-lactamase family protein